jgi:hypothetical protein
MKKLSINHIRFSLTKCTFVLLLLIGISTTSCKESFTDLAPTNALSDATAFATSDRVALAVTGVYDAAQTGFYTGGLAAAASRGYPLGAANTELGDNRGEDVIAVPSFYLITYQSTYTVATANNQFYWETLYALINRANVVIEGVQGAGKKGVITSEQALSYEGEARFLRALAHHELLVHYARPYAHTADASHLGVPYRIKAVQGAAAAVEAAAQGRNTVKECYDLLLQDLDFAETNLPATFASPRLKITHATKGAAIALKTRVYLHQGNFAKVVSEGAKLISGTGTALTSPIGGYKLTASTEGPFSSNYDNTESMFSIENGAADNGTTNGSISTMYQISPGRALVAISPIIWNDPAWLATDTRRTLLAQNNGRAYFSKKYRDITTLTDANPIIRYAEVLLNVAEATARVSGTTQASVDLLNAVRNRAVTVDNQFTLASFATANDLIASIIKERRIEFLCEGRRWSDIHRLAKDPVFTDNGIPAKVDYTGTAFTSWVAASPTGYTGPKITAAVPYDNFRFVWPIPQTEITSNPVLAAQQNPSY